MIPDGMPTVCATASWRPNAAVIGPVWVLTVDCPFRVPSDKHWNRPHQHWHGGGDDPDQIALGPKGADCGGGTYWIARAVIA